MRPDQNNIIADPVQHAYKKSCMSHKDNKQLASYIVKSEDSLESRSVSDYLKSQIISYMNLVPNGVQGAEPMVVVPLN